MDRKILFALDIGTRSVVGLVGEQAGNGIRLLAWDRQEHHTRAMFDGQIHDVVEVAGVLADVKTRLEKTCGPLSQVSVAAAGRALCTIKSCAELDLSGRGVLSGNDEHSLELAALQSAQQQLASSHAVPDPADYYCVGYSVVNFFLDEIQIKSLVGQKGKVARIELIATFLPRQVVDSLQSAVQAVGLEIAAITLEPIAAINVLIPHTMRHLNLALVDVGAGTSDIAITKGGAVVGYGMVPWAGDEITEAISQKYLLDFNVAEEVKRQLGCKKKVVFKDVLGSSHKLTSAEILESVKTNVGELAQAIAAQILALNSCAPQAVLLVGGGSLTPLLPRFLAQSLDIPANRVAIRRPEGIDSISAIPPDLCTPDAVTPLGILKIAGCSGLSFVNVKVNNQPIRLFNLGNLTAADALLTAGYDIRALHGRPGLGLTITLNEERRFIPGTLGRPGEIRINEQVAKMTDPIGENDNITVTPGENGTTPAPAVRDLIDIPASFNITVDGKQFTIEPIITINGQKASPSDKLSDRDTVVCRLPSTVAQALTALGFSIEPVQYTYTVNGTERCYSIWPQITLNDGKAKLSAIAKSNDAIKIIKPSPPSLAELLGIADLAGKTVSVVVDGRPTLVPAARLVIAVNGRNAAPSDIAPPGSAIEYSCSESPPTVSDVLLASGFNTRSLPPLCRVDILLNGSPAEYTAPVKNGDTVDIVVTGASETASAGGKY